MIDLETLYRRTLENCRPEVAVRQALAGDGPPGMAAPHLPRTVVAIGKCAGGLLDGVPSFDDAFVVIPHGYPPPRDTGRVPHVFRGGHPIPDEGSFDAGHRMLDFVRDHDDILFLISGGGSACVEAPLEPWFTRQDLIEAGRRIVAAGIPIDQMNVVRKHLSAIKGGRLGALVRGRPVTMLYSDVATGDRSSVASGPTLSDSSTKAQAIAILERVGGCQSIIEKLRDEDLPETVRQIERASATIIADNSTMVRAAARLAADAGHRPVVVEDQIESDVEAAAELLARKASELSEGEVLVAGGEPTVVAHGAGKGGRCLEVAVRFALVEHRHSWRQDEDRTTAAPLLALFGSSDGVDGNSGVAGAIVDRGVSDPAPLQDALSRSDSLSAIGLIGRPIIIPPTGNNLRDLYLVART